MSKPNIILHWFPYSPCAEVAAWVLNYKNIDYKVVQISPIEPRPLRRPLDGGYRKTPILQIGNHVYCDTRRIIDELEARFPEPSVYPKAKSGAVTKELAKGLSVWFDSTFFFAITKLFDLSILPEVFIKDRKEFMGDHFGGSSPYTRIDLLAQIAQAQALLGDKPYVLETPTLSYADLALAKDTYFLCLDDILGENWVKQNAPIMYQHLTLIKEKVNILRTHEMPRLSAEEALEIARTDARPLTDDQRVTNCPDLHVGQLVAVEPLDTGRVPSVGLLRRLTQDEIVIEHKSDSITTFIHFPTVGFAAAPATNVNP